MIMTTIHSVFLAHNCKYISYYWWFTSNVIHRMTHSITRDANIENKTSEVKQAFYSVFNDIGFCGYIHFCIKLITHASLQLQLIASNNVLGRREFLLESARKVGVEGAAEFLENPNNGVKEVCSILTLSHPSSLPHQETK